METRSGKSVLVGIINSDAISEEDKQVDRLVQEARVFVSAGTETTGASLENTVFHVLSNPSIHDDLRHELTELVTRSGEKVLTDYAALRSLPMLTAIINEGLRVSPSVSGRLPRIDRTKTHTYGSYVLPPGTVISMSFNMHFWEEAFPEPLEFKPERWLNNADKGLEKFFAPFGRGARTCVGKELALMNLYLALANFFYRFQPRLFETSKRDIEMQHDFFAPFPAWDSRGVRVMLD